MGRPRSIPGTGQKPPASRITMRPVKMTPLIEYMTEHQHDGKTSRELISEFRETCGHDFREIAYLAIEGSRTTYQVCQTCGLFVKGKGASVGQTYTKKKVQDED
jgi:hypothetical protein